MSEAPAAVATEAATSEAVVVRLGPGRFAVDLAGVAEVGRVPALTRVPRVPAWLAGVANWRGRVLPVLDLRALLGAQPQALGAGARLVVLAAEGVTVGLVVDLVEGTETLLREPDPSPSTLPASAAALLAGQLPHEGGPIAVLDVTAVLRLRESLPRARRSA